MYNKFSFIFVFCILLILPACAPKSTETTDYVIDNNPHVIKPDENSGIIYFFRPKSSGAFAVWYFVKEANNEICLMKNNTYCIHKAKPGKHTYTAKTEFSSSVDINVAPNSTNFIECNILPGFFVANPKLKIVNEDRFNEKKKELEYLRPIPKNQIQ